MREIKFRAWDFDSEQFFYFTMQDILHKIDFRILLPEMAYSNPDIQEYTGLRDKNGKEIYEGDKLEADSDFVGLVEYHKAEFNFVVGGYPYPIWKHCIVIGNLYENPELLGK